MSKELSDDDYNNSLKQSGVKEGIPISLFFNEICNDRNEKCRTPAKSRGNDSCGKSTTIRKPLHRGTDTAAVNKCRTNAREHVEEGELRQSGRVSHSGP